ncbi:hypothetical protein ASG79_19970 [Arthrobacter sp. Soil761]|nr:hypothetical protein ASG79_19970 [Arthrobacter sp. Soil761]
MRVPDVRRGLALHHPAVAVGIGEVGEQDAAQVLDFADVRAPPDQFGPDLGDVRNHQLQSLQAARRHGGHPGADDY